MFLTFTAIFQKGIILFIMIFVGYICGKTGMIKENGTRQITSLLLYVVVPCRTISSMQSIIGKVSINHILICAELSMAAMLTVISITYLFFRKCQTDRKKVLRFAAAYPNIGFMGIPLAGAILGNTGVAYASVFVVAFYLFCWSHGYISISSQRNIELKKFLFNPGLVGLAIGLPFFMFSYKFPDIAASPVNSFASVNTPLAMVVIGNFISRVNLKEIFTDFDLYKLCGIRLILAPLVVLALLHPFHFDKSLAATIVLLSSGPTAANTAMLAAQFGADAKLASKAVALTTLLSMLTMPVFSALANQFL